MKRMLVLCVCAVMVLFAATAFGAEIKTMNLIPERYALLMMTDAEPDQPLDKKKILEIVNATFKKLDVAQLQWAVYDKGKKPGDGVRAFGEKRKNKNAEVIEYIECTGEYAVLQGKWMENAIGYQPSPKELYNAYSDNEVVADEDFKGKPILLQIKVPKVAKDPFGKPYIQVAADKTGMFGVHIYLDSKDPFLRKIKRGSQILVRGVTRGFVMQSVVLDGVILSDGKSLLVDGKVLTEGMVQ